MRGFKAGSARNVDIDVDIPTTQLFVPSAIHRVPCEQHEAPLGVHCHRFESLISDTMIYGICNSRAKRAGMNDRIRPASLRSTR